MEALTMIVILLGIKCLIDLTIAIGNFFHYKKFTYAIDLQEKGDKRNLEQFVSWRKEQADKNTKLPKISQEERLVYAQIRLYELQLEVLRREKEAKEEAEGEIK